MRNLSRQGLRPLSQCPALQLALPCHTCKCLQLVWVVVRASNACSSHDTLARSGHFCSSWCALRLYRTFESLHTSLGILPGQSELALDVAQGIRDNPPHSAPCIPAPSALASAQHGIEGQTRQRLRLTSCKCGCSTSPTLTPFARGTSRMWWVWAWCGGCGLRVEGKGHMKKNVVSVLRACALCAGCALLVQGVGSVRRVSAL